MASSLDVLNQHMENISAQLKEMQATMAMWMSWQNALHEAQEKKTPQPGKISAVSPYASLLLRHKLPPNNDQQP